MAEIKTPTENIVYTLKGKKVLFLENDSELENGLDEFERILKDADIEYKVLFDLSDIPMEQIKKAINEADTIVFQTQWCYEISKVLFEYVKALPDKKVVVEVYIHEPTWYYRWQHDSKHDVYIYSCQVYWGKADKESERFYKLTDKAYWDYENKFDY